MSDAIRRQLHHAAELKRQMANDPATLAAIGDAAARCIDTLRAGHKILLAGNGGSAADAQHIAAELVGRLQRDRPSLAAIALTTDTSLLTAVANDYGFDEIFARQLRGLGRAGDLFIGLSTSGRSPNVVNALAVCRELGIATVGLTGRGGGVMAERCDCLISVPSSQTPRIQECHIAIGHILCAEIERVLFGMTVAPE